MATILLTHQYERQNNYASMNHSIKISAMLLAVGLVASCGGGAGESAPASQTVLPQPSKTQHTVSTSISTGGQISASQVVVDEGASAQFTLTPNTYYQIDSVSGCGGTLAGAVYTTAAVSADCTVSASFLYNNQAPSVTTLNEQSVDEFAMVTLSATANDVDGTIASYLWTQTSGINVNIANPTSPSVSFTLPAISKNERLEFSVTVSDNEGAQATSNSVLFVQHTPIIDSEAPANVVLVGASALSTSSISIQWLETSDNIMPSGEIKYTVFVGQSAGFVPNAQSNKLSLTGQSSAKVEGLSANTLYYLVVSAEDGDNNISYSNQISVKTMASEPVVNNSQTIKQLNSVVVSNKLLQYQLNDGELAPTVGEIIVSSSDTGLLRRVTNVTVNGDSVEVETVPASLNEIYTDVDINTTVKLIDIPDDTGSTGIQSQALSLNSNKQNALNTKSVKRSIYWDASSLMLSQNTIVENLSSTTTKTTSANQNLITNKSTQTQLTNAFDQSQVINDKYLRLTGPSRVVFTPNQENIFDIQAEVINDPNSQLELVDFTLIKVTHNRLLAEEANFNASVSDVSQDSNTHDKTLQLTWTPAQSDIDTSTSQPYIATFRAKVREKSCSVSCLKSTATINVKIHVANSSLPNSNVIAFETADANSNLSIEGDGQYRFEPELNIAAKIEDASMSKAHTRLSGFMDLQVKLKVAATQAGEVTGRNEFIRKSFTKLLVIGTVPVVVHGNFILSADYNAQAAGALEISQNFDIAYYFEAGFEYINGSWTPVFTGTPNLNYSLASGAKSELSTELTLVPEIQLSVYELSAAHIKIEPSMYGEMALEGSFVDLNDIPANDAAYTDKGAGNYYFNKLAAGLGTELKLSADFSAFDNLLLPWPQNSDELLSFTVLDTAQLYGIPTISIQDSVVTDASNSCAIAAIAQIAAPSVSIAEHLNHSYWEDQSTTWSLSSNVDNSLAQNNVQVINEADHSKAQTLARVMSQYNLRMSGFSELGAWARQSKAFSFTFTDNNNDLLPDYWAKQYDLTSPTNDSDNDGVNNLDEFKNCTFPIKSDSDNDGMPDGWEIANALNPVLNDADLDSDNDQRSNLQEYLDDSNPQVEDQNQAPVVDAGQDQSVDELTSVSLSATASDGGAIDSVVWAQIAGPLVGLSGNQSLSTSFTAPDVDETSTLTFEFTAFDNSAASSSARVNVTVNPLVVPNVAPSANAGVDVSVLSGQSVVLDASDSVDTDGSIVSYAWAVQEQQRLAINDSNAISTYFIAPEVVATTIYKIMLTVEDAQGATDTSLIQVEVSPNPDLPALSKVALSQLGDTVVIFRDSNSANLHSTLALRFSDVSQESSSVYLSFEQMNADNNEIDTINSQSALDWYIEDTTLVIESSLFGERRLQFDDGSIDINDLGADLASIIDAIPETNFVVSEIYKSKSLVTDSLKGYSFTVLANNKNSLVDFVSSTHAFIYEQGSSDIQSSTWSYEANEQGDKLLNLVFENDEPVLDSFASFNTWDSLGDKLIVDISVLAEIDKPIEDLSFSDPKLAACVQSTALRNHWLSVNELDSLDCSDQDITSAQGLDQLPELQALDLSGNELHSINISTLSKLETLYLHNNQLISIDFSNNPLLATASLTNNNMSNATIAYLSEISWIDSLSFDSTVVVPSGNDFVLLVTLEAEQEFSIYADPSFDYDYSIDWGDGTHTFNHTESTSHTYAQAGAYQITISGEYPAFRFCTDNSGCDNFKIDIMQWGSNEWLSMEAAFSGLEKFTILASDTPNLSQVNNISFMFYKATNFNSDISAWDVSSVTEMVFTFGLASSFNGDISQWDTSNVTDMGGLFYFASSFNTDISNWNTSSVTRMHSLFAFASNFNGDISQWDTSSVSYMATMFMGASSFDGNLSLWDVSAVDNMNKMFYDATNMSGNLSNWAVKNSVSHNDFTHEESLLVEPIWKN